MEYIIHLLCVILGTLGPTPCPSLHPIPSNSLAPIVDWQGIMRSLRGGPPGITEGLPTLVTLLVSLVKGSRVVTSRGAIPKTSKSYHIYMLINIHKIGVVLPLRP